MTQVALLSRVKAKPGKADELIAAFQPLFDQVEKEPGTLIYLLQRSTDDPDQFWVSELYADENAFAAHRDSQALAAAGPALMAAITETEVLVGAPILTKGV
ncbi:putative quinol monooxygenase [Nonomuraea rubra]|uniref:putative quinol monooxygenase n=1 Tax=Nonomuraea rubra TaxID=46180 RepID=UPI0033C2AA7E